MVVQEEASQINDLWEALGALGDDENRQVLVHLFTAYEELLRRDPADRAAEVFYRLLAQALNRTVECNLNRR
jgi:hypothetical protein